MDMTNTLRAAVVVAVLGVGCGGANAFTIIDNWHGKQTPLAQDSVRLHFNMVPLHRGGDGEARVMFRRKAEALAAAAGYRGFEVIEYSEGIESGLLFSQRYVDGVVRFTP
jgi:hypothetical protein